MKNWVRDNKFEAGFVAFLLVTLTVTIVSWVWSLVSGEVHTAWEVIAYLVFGTTAVATAVAVLLVVIQPFAWIYIYVKERPYVGKHTHKYIRSHRFRLWLKVKARQLRLAKKPR